MIELQHFSIGYKENSLLHEVNATIKKGQLTALIGRNGTGKSTLSLIHISEPTRH